MQNNPQRPPQPIKVAIEIEKPEKIGDSWSVLATAIVSQGNRTLDGREVQFFTNGIPYDQPVQTDNNGRAQIDIADISADTKRVSVEAQIIGQSPRARKIITLPNEKKETKDVEVSILVTREKDEILSVILARLDENKKGLPGKIVYVDQQARIIETDEFGMVTLEFTRNRRRQVVVFPAERSGKKIWIDVDDATPIASPAPAPTPTNFATRFMNNFNRGWNSLTVQKEEI